MRFIGWDLSDPFSRRPRPVDVAVVEEHGGVRFDERLWPPPDRSGRMEEKGLKKASREGRVRRRELLEVAGLRFPEGELPTHDQLDAALCAWLGWLTRTAPERVQAVGMPLWVDSTGWLREGRILDVRLPL